MCDRCEIDMLLYGGAVRCKAPVWEKGRFQAKAVEEKPPVRDGGKAEPVPDGHKPGREQE